LLLQLPALESALITAHPDSRELIQREAGRLRTTLQTLADLAVSLKTKLSENPPKVVTDGPEFLYLLRDLGIDPVRIQWPVDSAVNNGVADQIRQTAPQNGHPPALFILNDRRSAESEKVVSDAGFRVLRLDDLEQTSETKNAVTRLADNLRAFQACLETAPFSTPQ
jgi:ABC-type Zn uptake system ZnuABC Zn-binding protein ZnuA